MAISQDLSAGRTDQAVDLFDRLIGAMFRKAEGRHACTFQADARAINDKVRLYARGGAALITGRNDQQDGYDAIIALMSWENFCANVAEAEALARPEEFDAYKNLGEHYAGVRRWSPAFLDAFVLACAAERRWPQAQSMGSSNMDRAAEALHGGLMERLG